MPYYKRHGAITELASASGIEASHPNAASLFGKATAPLATGGWVTASAEKYGMGDYTRAVVRTYDASGTLQAQTIHSNWFRPTTTDLAVTGLPGGGWALAYAQNETVNGGVYVVTSSGVRTSLPARGGDFTYLDIATLNDGGFIVSWVRPDGAQFYQDVVVQRFAADGTAVGSIVVVDITTNGSVYESSATALADGGYLITWNQRGQIMGQLFDAGGQKGAIFRADTGGGTQTSTAGLPDGGFVISWVSGVERAVTLQLFDSNGAKVGSEFVAGHSVAGLTWSEIPELDVLPGGEIVVAWRSADGIVKQSFVPVAGSAPGDLDLSRLTVSETGAENVAVAAFTVVDPVNLPGDTAFNYAILSDSSGGAFALSGDQLMVVDRGKLDSGTATVNVTVRVTDGNGASYEEAFALTVTDSPAELVVQAGNQILVNTTAAGTQLDPALARLGSGWVATWTDGSASGGDTSGTSVRGQIFDATGGRLGAEFQVNSQTASDQRESAVTALASGKFVAVWVDANHPAADGSLSGIKGQLFDATGAALGSEFLVNSSTPLDQMKPSVTALANGGFVATWSDEAGSGAFLKGQVFDASGAKLGAEFRANTSATGTSASTTGIAALTGGGFVVAWDSHGSMNQIVTQRFSATGEKLGGEIAVSTAVPEYLPPAVAGLPGDAFVVTWTQASDIYARVHDAAGNALGLPFLVNSTATGAQAAPAVVMLDGGLFVVAWGDSSKFGSGGGGNIRAQLFTADGVKVGDEFVVNGVPGDAIPYDYSRDGIFDGYVSPVSVAATVDGFVVSWASDSGDGSGQSVKARSFSLADFAQDDAAATAEGTPAIIAVQSNDNAPAPGISMINGVLVDPGAAIALPSGALLTVNNDGTLTYDDRGVFGDLVSPARAAAAGAVNGSATDSFSYRLAAGGAATVNVTVEGTDEPEDLLIFGEGKDTYRSGSASERMDGRGGSDVFLLQDGGEDHAIGGIGDDAFYFGAALSAGDFADGGAGSDQVGIQGSYGSLTLDAWHFAGIETFAILAGNDTSLGAVAGIHSYDITTSGSFGRNLIVNMNGLQAGESVIFNGSAETTGGFTFYGSAGSENLIGGAKDDGFFFGEGRFGSADGLDGGAGSDNQIGLRGDYTIDFSQGGYSSSLTNIQTLALISAQDARYAPVAGQDFDYSITLGDGLVSGTGRFTVNGNGLGSDETMVVDGSDEASGTLRLIGGAASDTLTGGGGDDQLFGGLGADQLTGNGGRTRSSTPRSLIPAGS